MAKEKQLVEDAKKVIGELIPPEIVDKEAYLEFKRLSTNPILNERKYVTISTGKRFSLGTATHHIERFIEDLPVEEQNKILLQRKVWNDLHCKRLAAQNKAYGTHVNARGQTRTKQEKFILVQKELIELFGRMFTAKEVHELVVTQFHIDCTLGAIQSFRERHLDEIGARIEEHKRTYSDIRLGYKRSRLEELTWLYRHRKRIYEVSKKGDDHRLLLQTLEQIRKEIEGDSLRIDGNINANVEVTVENHIQKELFVHFPLKELILARVAARANVSVTQLVSEMDRSYYNTFLQSPNLAEAELPMYPSTQTYDFDRIRLINRQQEQIEAINQVKVISPEQNAAASNIKEALLAKLRNRSEHVNHNKEKLAGKFIDKSAI